MAHIADDTQTPGSMQMEGPSVGLCCRGLVKPRQAIWPYATFLCGVHWLGGVGCIMLFGLIRHRSGDPTGLLCQMDFVSRSRRGECRYKALVLLSGSIPTLLCRTLNTWLLRWRESIGVLVFLTNTAVFRRTYSRLIATVQDAPEYRRPYGCREPGPGSWRWSEHHDRENSIGTCPLVWAECCGSEGSEGRSQHQENGDLGGPSGHYRWTLRYGVWHYLRER